MILNLQKKIVFNAGILQSPVFGADWPKWVHDNKYGIQIIIVMINHLYITVVLHQ